MPQAHSEEVKLFFRNLRRLLASDELTSGRIANDHSFKIFALHRDENELLEDWVRYHAAIVGHHNIYILDNNSTVPDVVQLLDTLHKVSDIGLHAAEDRALCMVTAWGQCMTHAVSIWMLG